MCYRKSSNNCQTISKKCKEKMRIFAYNKVMPPYKNKVMVLWAADTKNPVYKGGKT